MRWCFSNPWRNVPGNPPKIRLVETDPKNRAAARQAAHDDERSFEANRGDFVFWNGTRGAAWHSPPG